MTFKEESFSEMATSPHKKPDPAILCIGDAQDTLFGQVQRIAESRYSPVQWPENRPLKIDPALIAQLHQRDVVLVHRRNVGPIEVESITRIRRLIESKGPDRPRFELILGDLARYADVQILATLTDRITPEGVALEVLAGRIRRLTGKHPATEPFHEQQAIGLLSQSRPLMEMLAEWVRFCGFEPVIMDGWSDPKLSAGSLVIWDAPLLNDRWETELKAQAHRRPVIALLGMTTRDLTARAKVAGAVACLDLPFETDDLTDLIFEHVPKRTTGSVPARNQPASAPQTLTIRSGKTILRAEAGHSAENNHRHARQSQHADKLAETDRA